MKKPLPQKVLVLGSGALKIGEAGEFDYSGSQAIKALKDEGIYTVLVNPNIATIQTSDNLADRVYLLPITPYFVEKVIEKERPDGILLGFGGQTALNCGVELARLGILEKCGVRVLGTPVQTIRDTEDRDLFVKRLAEIGVNVPRSFASTSVEEAVRLARAIGYPVMLRIAYALGGLGSGRCLDEEEVRAKAGRAFAHSPQVLVEECLSGYKEVEYEVVRDQNDNCVTVCNMENVDPMGIHTGESIVVAPSQTLTNREYHMLRALSIRVVRHLGIVGECNIQFALDPDSEDYRVIEVNARLSRSSALASKATGYPLAFVAAKLALGYALPSLTNSVTGVTTACFEPALDYIVVKMPRWDLQKFRKASNRIGPSMKSVGEVMAIGRTFEESLQKALRMLDIGVCGLVGNLHLSSGIQDKDLSDPGPNRILAVAAAFDAGYSAERIHALSNIDEWFLFKIRNIVELAGKLRSGTLSSDLLMECKQAGFSDMQIANLAGLQEQAVKNLRDQFGIFPCVKQIDTLAAEYPARTNYLYLTYNGQEDDVAFDTKDSVMVLGSGAYRIGSSVEFDWCCVNTVRTLRGLGYKTITVNYNPETVSTDYNECDRLYFDELSFESVAEIYRKEQPLGVVLSAGGQIPNNLATALHERGFKVLGTSPDSIDAAEDRNKFSLLLDELGIEQPEWRELGSLEGAKLFANQAGYPVLVRPSYVLSGAAMSVASNDLELVRFLEKATQVSSKHPTVISKFVENAKELEIDAVACKGAIVVSAISEHVENAGVHSGDATLVFPPQRTYPETMRRIRRITEKIAGALQIDGPFNIQFIAKDNDVKVIECNLRASRSFPFVSKVSGINFVEMATKVMTGHSCPRINGFIYDLNWVGVKAPQFSFMRLDGADPVLGVEMASTGEVACLGEDFDEAFLKSLLSVGYELPLNGILLSTGPIQAKAAFLECAQILQKSGQRLYATKGTSEFLGANGIESTVLHWPLDSSSPNALEYIQGGSIKLVINIPKNYQEEELTNDYLIRRCAVDFGVPLITDIQLAQRFVQAYARKSFSDLQIKAWQEYRSDPS
jgi:carbamoyl-phosphate synthase large subunit